MKSTAMPKGIKIFFPKNLPELSDSALDHTGKLVASVIKRHRDMLLCKRDGHLPAQQTGEYRTCTRCGMAAECYEGKS